MFQIESPNVTIIKFGKSIFRRPVIYNFVNDTTAFISFACLCLAYAKGFPADEELDEILKHLESHGPIESCNKRSYMNKATKQQVFKGSCFITFKNLDDCKKFVEAESIKYKETELIRKFKERYIEGKREEVRELRNARKKDKEAAKVAAVESTKLALPKGASLAFSGVAEGQVLTREEIRDKVCMYDEWDRIICRRIFI